MMRAAVYDEYGEPATVLHTKEVTKPQPKEHEVLVKTTLAAVHNHDVSTVQGRYGVRPALPAIGGSEAVGVVEAVGAAVTSVKPGARVAVAGAQGTWAEYFTAPATSAVVVPDDIADEAAAQLISMPVSAHILVADLGLQPGDWFAMNTANGVVGIIADSVAKSKGLHMLKIVRRDEAKRQLEALGMEHVVSTEHSGWRDEVKRATGGEPIKSGIDCIGGSAAGDLLDLLGYGGQLVSFGCLEGKPLELSAQHFIFNAKTVRGFWLRDGVKRQGHAAFAEAVQATLRDVRAGKLTLSAQAVVPLDDIRKAIVASLSHKKGKVLVKP